MKARSADKSTVNLTFNETDIDRSMPACEEECHGEVVNETIDVSIPDIKIDRVGVSKIESQRLYVVDARARV